MTKLASFPFAVVLRIASSNFAQDFKVQTSQFRLRNRGSNFELEVQTLNWKEFGRDGTE